MSTVIQNRKGAVRILVAYFSLPSPLPGCDVIRLRNTLTRPPDGRWGLREARTVLLDLSQAEEKLLGEMNEGTRYEIRRAQRKDNFSWSEPVVPDETEIARFQQRMTAFAAGKGIPAPAKDFLRQLRVQRSFHLSGISAPELGEIVTHAYIGSGDRMRLLYSVPMISRDAPSTAALVGRANRLLHWIDICSFQKAGRKLYDLGGVHLDGDVPELASIARFKLGFGGQVVTEYKCIRGQTWLGRLALVLKGWQGPDGDIPQTHPSGVAGLVSRFLGRRAGPGLARQA